MLTVDRPTPELAAAVRARLEARWMPGDWFTLDDRVAGHYAWKAAVIQAADLHYRWPVCVQMVEIGTRAGYSLQAFAEGVPLGLDALCLDAYCDADSADTRRHFRHLGCHGRGIGSVQLVVADTANVLGINCDHFAHVDGEHTAPGVYRDLTLVQGAAVILADDCDNADVMTGVREWLKDHPDRRCQFIDDGLRVLAVISSRGPTTGPRG